MTLSETKQAIEPVQKTITVKAGADRAFRVFTQEFNSWWPSTHHIGKAPLKRSVLETHLGGRCYSEHTDGSECHWGQVTAWDPPHRVVLAWQITPAWGFEPDLGKSSEVEIRFVPQSDGSTRVDLEHRHLDRHGDGALAMHEAIGGSGGWSGILGAFGSHVDGDAGLRE